MNKSLSLLVLGSTGSIGKQTLEVISQYPERFKCVGLSAHTNIDLLMKQVRQFSPVCVAVTDSTKKKDIIRLSTVKVFQGKRALEELIEASNADMVVVAISGIAALKATMCAISFRKKVALASKEVLVAAGHLVIQAAQKENVTIYPIDSEHAAIDLCLRNDSVDSIEQIILTASGGPFWKRKDWRGITLKEALNHPNWDMGSKITIDSATMMNKGLEIIEAHWLFGLPYNKINVLIHPQSIVHGLVKYKNGMMLAQMSMPDMRIPILYAISERKIADFCPADLDLTKVPLEFHEPDRKRFRSLGLAYDVGRRGGSWPIVMNGANEECVGLCLKGRMDFNNIVDTVETVLSRHRELPINNVDDVIEVDKWSRASVNDAV